MRFDTQNIHRVVSNLLSNALKFTEGGGRIEIQSVWRDDQVEVGVVDTGIGVADVA